MMGRLLNPMKQARRLSTEEKRTINTIHLRLNSAATSLNSAARAESDQERTMIVASGMKDIHSVKCHLAALGMDYQV